MARPAVMWIAMLLGGFIWFLTLETNLVLTQWSCGMHGKIAGYIAFAVALAISAAASAFCWSQWTRAGRALPDETGGELHQIRVLAFAGALLNAAFFLLLIAQTIPHIMMTGCE